MVIAALCADGVTEIADVHHIDRGYEDLEGKLTGLGRRGAARGRRRGRARPCGGPVIPSRPPSASADPLAAGVAPPRPDGSGAGRGARRACPSSTGRSWEALVIGFVTNIVLAQVVVASSRSPRSGVTTSDDPKAVYVGVIADLAWFGFLVLVAARGGTRVARAARDPRAVRPASATASTGVVAGVVLYPAIAFVVGIPLTILFSAALRARGDDARPAAADTSGPAGDRVGRARRVRGPGRRGALLPRRPLPIDPRPVRVLASARCCRRWCSGSSHYVPAAVAGRAPAADRDGVHRASRSRGSTSDGATWWPNIAAHMAFNAIGISLILVGALRAGSVSWARPGEVGGMPMFASQEWFEAFGRGSTRSEDYREAAADWEGDIAFRDRGRARPRGPRGRLGLPRPVARRVPRRGGSIDAAERGRRAAYTLTAPYSRWKDVVQGELDPIKGMMQGKLRVRGDLPDDRALRARRRTSSSA